MKIFANHTAIATSIAVVLLIVGLLVGAVVVYFLVPGPGTTTTVVSTVSGAGTTVSTTVTATQGPVTYTIGTVLPLTGTYGSYGVSFQNAVNLAVDQMNSNLSAAGSNIKFAVVSEDDAGVPQTALTDLQTEYQTNGIQVEIGPLTSGEVLALVQYATQNHIVLLPGAATATSLIGASSYLFRPGQPGDQFEGQVIAESIIQTGQKNVVYLYRDDTSENGTYAIAAAAMTAAGLNVEGIAMTPNQNDYSAQVQTAEGDVAAYLSSGGTVNNTCVVIGDGGTEAANVFTNAATTAHLGLVRWYGIESLQDPTLLGASVGAFMSQVHLTIAAPQVLNSPQFEYFNSSYIAKFGSQPLPYSNYFYDNAWIAMLSVLAAGSYNGAKIIQVMPTVIDHFFGSSSTGIWLVHNDQSIAYYDVLECQTVSGMPTFVEIGTYNGGTNQLTLT
jgi:branched-chain amino acid transport system substrate-binding protein